MTENEWVDQFGDATVTYMVVPGDHHLPPQRGQHAVCEHLPIGTRVTHYGTRQDAVIVGVDGPYSDGTWEYQIVTIAPADGTLGPEKPRWWPQWAILNHNTKAA